MLNGILWDKQIFNKSLVRGVLTYDAEVWILNQNWTKARNDEIRKEMDYQNSIIDYVHSKQLRQSVHIQQMEDSRLPNQGKLYMKKLTTWHLMKM